MVVVLDHDDPENEAAYLPERFSARAPFAQVRFSWTEAGTVAAVETAALPPTQDGALLLRARGPG